jgi:hypothetical protein
MSCATFYAIVSKTYVATQLMATFGFKSGHKFDYVTVVTFGKLRI